LQFFATVHQHREKAETTQHPPQNTFGFFRTNLFLRLGKTSVTSYSLISLIVLLVGCGESSIENERRAAADSAGSDRTAGEKADLDPVRGLEDLISRQDWASAGQQISAALISQPDNPAVLTNAALVNAKLGNLREAAQLMVSAATASGFDINGPRVDYAIKALIDVGNSTMRSIYSSRSS